MRWSLARVALSLLAAVGCAPGASSATASKDVPAPGTQAGGAWRSGAEQALVDRVLGTSKAPGAAVILDLAGPRVLALGRHLGADPVTQARVPASTVKPLVAWMAAEAGVLVPRERVTCDGTFPGPENFFCVAHHGSLDLPGAIAVSCNVYFMELGRRLGLERVATGLRAFGLATPTGLAPNEAAGLVADPAWVAAHPELPPARRELIVAAGHGPLEVTLLQLAVAYGRLAERLSKPDPRVPDGVRFEILDGLRRVVSAENGTGRAARVPGLDMAGKTGTAESAADAENGWFVGFAPADHPERVVAVVVLGAGGGGATAAPLAGKIFGELLPRGFAPDPH